MANAKATLTITERQYRALREAIQRVVEACGDRSGLTERKLRQWIRNKWGVEDERELLQAEFHSVAEYLNRWLLCGCDNSLSEGRVQLLKRIHDLRAKLGWDMTRLKEFAKQKVGRSSLNSMSGIELISLLRSLEAMCESEQ
ncbi:MAG: hypothetical protein RMK18_05520 [Armatimonadota bacterium]|nr:hypothetical protein [Armatimonadota bacterium]MDW8025310.1 hypothetical protein [Armatimonadota bacterium]